MISVIFDKKILVSGKNQYRLCVLLNQFRYFATKWLPFSNAILATKILLLRSKIHGNIVAISL